MTPPSTRLTSAQVAARLDVKPATLYAYVSRGLLRSARAENGGSTFDPLDVEAFAASRRRGSRSGGSSAGRPLTVVESDLTLLQDDALYFRGVSAVDLARRCQFEEAVSMLWATPHQRDGAPDQLVSDPETVAAIRLAAASLGDTPRFVDRFRLALLICALHDPERASLQPSAVMSAGRRMLAAVVDALPDLQPAPSAAAPLARRLWAKISPLEPSTGNLRVLNATMVLCMDHDLAISTMSARVAASARADPYAAVTAALSTFDGAVHGAASIAAVSMLTETLQTGNAEQAISRQIKKTGMIPGFGHLIYRDVDPRAELLLAAMRQLPSFQGATTAADRIVAVVRARSPRPANLDLALAALAIGGEMDTDAGELIFAVSRTAGWIAHALDEYTQPAARLRPESRYTGTRPASPAAARVAAP